MIKEFKEFYKNLIEIITTAPGVASKILAAVCITLLLLLPMGVALPFVWYAARDMLGGDKNEQ